MKIEFEIISRGSMIVRYGSKVTTIYGELVFNPPIFYADTNSLKKWDNIGNNYEISEEERTEIIIFLTSNSATTKIIFD